MATGAALSYILTAMHRVYFDTNEGYGERYDLRSPKAARDLARIPGGPKHGMTITIYMVGEVETEAVLEWDVELNQWLARPIGGRFRDNHESWEDDIHRI